MGLFGGSKSYTSVDTRTQNVGFSDIGGPALALQGSGNTIMLTDQGALKVAGDIAAQAFGSIDMASKRAAAGIAQAVEAVAESNREESENIVGNVKTVAILGVLAWVVISVAKGFRG